MYEKHFNLKERPFRNVPDTRMFFNGGGRGDILSALRFAIESGEGIIKVVGEVGSGKTMICRMLNESLSGKVQVVFLSNPSLEPDYILHAVAQELGLPIELSTNRFTVQQLLQDYLLEQHANKMQVVVLIEEAQCMPARTLEEIRLMSNLETEQKKLLQLVLFGQPELDVLLNRPDLRQFNERISYALNLKPFTFEEHREYLNHRFLIAGYQGPELFNAVVLKHIYKFAKGSLRRINLLADKTLLAAYAYNDSVITIKHARSAAEDSKYIDRGNIGVPLKYVVPASIIAIAVFAFLFNENYLNENTTPDVVAIQSNAIAVTEQIAETITASVSESVTPDYDDIETPELKISESVAENDIVETSKIESKSPENNYSFTKVSSQSSNQLFVETRLEETIDWLKTADRSQYTIQLMTAFVNEPAELYEIEEMLKNQVEKSELKNFYIFRGNAKGLSVFVICYRIFPGLSGARNALVSLSPMLKRYRPFIRNVSSILLEIDDSDV